MKSEIRSLVTKWDIVIVAALLLLSLALGIVPLCLSCASDGGESFAVITRGGETLARLPLDEDAEYVVDSGEERCVVKIENGAVYMAESSCEDRLCVRSGSIDKDGQSIICLPLRVVVTVEDSGTDDDIDSTVY